MGLWVCPFYLWSTAGGKYHNLLQECISQLSYFRYLRVSKDRFGSLLVKVKYGQLAK